jgi:hypothetical protein
MKKTMVYRVKPYLQERALCHMDFAAWRILSCSPPDPSLTSSSPPAIEEGFHVN